MEGQGQRPQEARMEGMTTMMSTTTNLRIMMIDDDDDSLLDAERKIPAARPSWKLRRVSSEAVVAGKE